MALGVVPAWDYIIGAAVIGGGTLIVILNRLKLIKLPGNDKPVLKRTAYMNFNPEDCRKEILAEITRLREANIEQKGTLDNHTEKLEEGSAKFDAVNATLGELNVGMATLLERTSK